MIFVSDKCRQAYEYWQSLFKGGRLPARSDISPHDIPQLLPNLMLKDVLKDPHDFRYRLIGSEICRHITRDYTGWKMSEISGQGPESALWKLMTEVIETGKPIRTNPPYVGPYSEFKSIEGISMPLSEDGKTVNMIFICADFILKDPSRER
ncbi:PAS domain-containing protein [Kiloniella sp. b19]|uniref:PAS domain-containing protein n=1 Tax=Kiloniella sp. GXU_MW_B19 TaxID=3141326 RepID=UPI0031E081FA